MAEGNVVTDISAVHICALVAYKMSPPLFFLRKRHRSNGDMTSAEVGSTVVNSC